MTHAEALAQGLHVADYSCPDLTAFGATEAEAVTNVLQKRDAASWLAVRGPDGWHQIAEPETCAREQCTGVATCGPCNDPIERASDGQATS